MATNCGSILGVDLTDTPTTSDRGIALGQRAEGTDNSLWVFTKASTAITQYDTVAIDEDFNILPITTTLARTGMAVGFAQVAFVDNDYGWVALKGTNIRARGAAACAPDIALYTSAVAGVLDDAATTTLELIRGVVFVTTASATNAEIIATWPQVSAP